jgi:uncharacterized protein
VNKPLPVITDISAPYWKSLEQGALSYAQCSCGHRWLPARVQCPACLGTDWQWLCSSGRARIISWVIYHVAYHEAFANEIPYNVALVELDEGPRLISNVIGCAGGHGLAAGMALELVVEYEQSMAVARFRPLRTQASLSSPDNPGKP